MGICYHVLLDRCENFHFLIFSEPIFDRKGQSVTPFAKNIFLGKIFKKSSSGKSWKKWKFRKFPKISKFKKNRHQKISKIIFLDSIFLNVLKNDFWHFLMSKIFSNFEIFENFQNFRFFRDFSDDDFSFFLIFFCKNIFWKTSYEKN